jgi:hypothetical protein
MAIKSVFLALAVALLLAVAQATPAANVKEEDSKNLVVRESNGQQGAVKEQHTGVRFAEYGSVRGNYYGHGKKGHGKGHGKKRHHGKGHGKKKHGGYMRFGAVRTGYGSYGHGKKGHGKGHGKKRHHGKGHGKKKHGGYMRFGAVRTGYGSYGHGKKGHGKGHGKKRHHGKGHGKKGHGYSHY